jgi:ketosteroid isomerase-like protein
MQGETHPRVQKGGGTVPLSMEDTFKLQRLYAEYVQLFDRGDRDGWLDLFTDDLVYRIVPRNSTGEWSEPTELHGHQALADYWDYRKDMYEGAARHFSTDALFDGDGDEATGRAHSMVVLAKSTGPEFRITGVMEDELRRDSTGWRFKSRTAHPDL